MQERNLEEHHGEESLEINRYIQTYELTKHVEEKHDMAINTKESTEMET